MSESKNNGRGHVDLVNQVVDEFHEKEEELIPILMKINQEIGYLPSEALELISSRLHIPKSRLFTVATFYHMLFTKPMGRHVVKFCESAPCHVAGGREVWEKLQSELGLKSGESSQDGKWTLITTSCLGVCAVGPVMLVDEDIYGNIYPDDIPGILEKYN